MMEMPLKIRLFLCVDIDVVFDTMIFERYKKKRYM